MVNEHNALIVLVPTRNRAHLAIDSIRSVLSQRLNSVRVIVSDNSTIKEEFDTLWQFCKRKRGERIHYMRPPEPLAMTQHWNWAIEQALETDATHFTVLTDRMVFRPGELKSLLEITEQHPSKILSYKHDKVADLKPPVKLQLQEWTGNLFEIRSERLLQLTAQAILHESLPRMLNCIVPRRIFNIMQESFGAGFDSISPDFNFCYKALGLEETILFYDKAVLIHRALNRSNGQTAARGLCQGDLADFLANLDPKQLNFAAPIPQLRTVFNGIIHEYCLIKEQSTSLKFPEIDFEKYLALNASDAEAFENPTLRNEVRAILVKHGWTVRETMSTNKGAVSEKELTHPLKITAKLSTKLKSPGMKAFWPFLAKYFAIQPPEIGELEFKSTKQALAYACKFPRDSSTWLPFDESLLEYILIDNHRGPNIQP